MLTGEVSSRYTTGLWAIDQLTDKAQLVEYVNGAYQEVSGTSEITLTTPDYSGLESKLYGYWDPQPSGIRYIF